MRGTLSLLRVLWLTFDKALILLLIFKALVLFDIGEGQYRARLASYKSPTSAEQIGLFVMKLDPLTLQLRNVAEQLRALENRPRVLAHL